MGTIALEASNDEGATWTSIWSESGNKGNSWQNASVNLSAYLGDGIQLRFNRVTGGTWQADIAIDNVNLTSSSSARSEDIAITNNDEISNVEISLYPNPVKGNQIFVKSNIEGMSYSVFNTIGQQVAKGVLRSNTIDVSNLDGGMYMIQFNVNDTIETRKFLKQ